MTAHLSDDDILELKQRLALMKKEALEEIETANADIRI